MPRRRPKKVFEEELSWSDKLAQIISDLVGNIWFVWVHAFIFVLWIGANVLLGDKGWDPYPFIFLVLVVSLEAIFLATFVLMAQNRESRENEIRDSLDYEVDQRAELEIQELKKMVQRLLDAQKK
ncbi:DUF1003 domain-containing protein [Patescibacteria group bacterium]|nr:DUF1003 domain-containing protein [Patescibacteria group bacterium]